MAASYPTATKSFSTKLPGATVASAHVNDLQDEVVAIENGLRAGLAHDLLFIDATYDIGKSGATRPRDLFISRNGTIGGTLGVAGVGTFSSTGTRGLVVTNAQAGGSGIQLSNTSGSGTAWGFAADALGNFSIAHDVDGDPVLTFTAAGAASLGASAGITLSDSVVLAKAETLTSLLSPAQIAANTNNYNPTGLSTARVLRLTTDASRNLTGIVAQVNGRVLTLSNLGSFNLVLKHQDAGSTAANRFICPGAADFTLNAFDCVDIWYDSASFGTGAWVVKAF